MNLSPPPKSIADRVAKTAAQQVLAAAQDAGLSIKDRRLVFVLSDLQVLEEQIADWLERNMRETPAQTVEG